MKHYKVVSVLWQDHSAFTTEGLPENVDDLILPSMTIGLLVKKTKKHLVIAYNLERYYDRDDADFMVIFRNSVLGIQEYGSIPIKGLRTKEGST